VILTATVSNAAAVLEWAVAFIFTFYVIVFAVDLAPAVHTKAYTNRDPNMSMEQNDALSSQGLHHNRNSNGFANGSNGYYGNGQNGYVANGVHGNGKGQNVRPANNY
jgi:hypothetical protein